LPEAGRLTFSDALADAVAGAVWIQESVPERLDIKLGALAIIQAHCPPEAVIGSSTSGYKPADLRSGSPRPSQIVVAHPFVPVYLLPLVELVAGNEPDEALVARAEDILAGIGMKPLRIRKEIDAHIADRLLEGVWREALWLVRDGVATTEEIDDAILYGFGLRWAQMGLFETYRLGGGPGGMRHFIAQFAPALALPWSRLTDVPELDYALAGRIADQSDAQSGHLTSAELARRRDDNLVAILRALKARGSGAGALLAAHEARLPEEPSDAVPMVTVRRTIPIDWTDYSGHMNEGRYGQVFSDAADAVMRAVGADAGYIAAGFSYITVETSVRYHDETLVGEAVMVTTRVRVGEGRKLGLVHAMRRAKDGNLLAACEQFLLHVSLETRRSCDPAPEMAARIAALADRHCDAKT
jgi:carnitine 3-dehydrogenase